MTGANPPAGPRIVHISSAHHADDIRIFWKECLTAAEAGYDVSFVVPDDGAPRQEAGAPGVEIVPVRRPASRLARMAVVTTRVVRTALERDAALYHFHDPELIPGGLALRLIGRRVIYDAHEDLPRDILFKDWIPGGLRRPVSLLASALEWIAGRALSGVVAATPTIAARFPQERVALVQNFARLAEFAEEEARPKPERRAVAYVGAVTPERCAVEMVKAIGQVGGRCQDARLILGGVMSPCDLEAQLAALSGWERVDYRGRQDRAGVRRILQEARAGLAVLHPVQSYMESQPTKIYEYMAAGLPVIAADFPNFRKIVEENGCGLCVPPRDPSAIASAIEWIFGHAPEAEAMGRRGRALILGSLNWEQQAQALLDLYRRILGPAPVAAGTVEEARG